MKITFADNAWEDYLYWQATDKKQLKRINNLIKDIQRSPFEGIGKPEPLKFNLSGFWSRRIDEEHRLVYAVTDDTILIAACRYHYKIQHYGSFLFPKNNKKQSQNNRFTKSQSAIIRLSRLRRGKNQRQNVVY